MSQNFFECNTRNNEEGMVGQPNAGIVDHKSFECNMYTTQQEAEFETANPTTMAIKLAKYGKQQRSVGFVV
jgi:hypothetical protein